MTGQPKPDGSRPHHGSSDDPSMLDFSANTNPVVPSGVERVYRAAFDSARTYPAEPPSGYCVAAAEYVGCSAENVIPTPGGLAALRLAIRTIVAPGDSVVIPYPSFGEYAYEVQLQGGEPVFVPQEELLAVEPAAHDMVILCNPNNPTGEAAPERSLRELADRCARTETPLLVDEAFLGFSERRSLAGTDGVVVARALTKLFGLPGLRVGFGVATGELQGRMQAARRTWNMSAPAIATGRFCMQAERFVERTRDRVARERARMRTALVEADYDVAPSDAPFLLLDVKDRDPHRVLEGAAAEGIALRDARTFRGLENHVRVAVRLPAENDRLLEVLGGL